MNYTQLYDRLCHYCATTDPFTRMRSRNLNDPRLSETTETLYQESHHIIPRHAGGTDDDANLVMMLPEEHYMAHLIRYRAFKQRSDFLAVRFIRNGVMNPSKWKDKVNIRAARGPFLRRLGLFKQHIATFRRQHGWQSEAGRERIAESKRGMILCVDASTGERVGFIKNTHPKVISGEYVHARTGRVSVIDTLTGKKLDMTVSARGQDPERYIPAHVMACGSSSGANNNNYKELTDDRLERLFRLIPLAVEDGYLRKKTLTQLMKEEFACDFKRVGIKWIGNISDLLTLYNTKHGTSYAFDPYIRTRTQIATLKHKEKYRWITDGQSTIKVLESDLAEFLTNNPHFTLGRTIK